MEKLQSMLAAAAQIMKESEAYLLQQESEANEWKKAMELYEVSIKAAKLVSELIGNEAFKQAVNATYNVC